MINSKKKNSENQVFTDLKLKDGNSKSNAVLSL